MDRTFTAVELKSAIQRIFTNRKPKMIQTNKGTEFLNSHVKTMLKRKGIKLFTTK